MKLDSFLNALYPEQGFIEVRLIEEKKDGRVVRRNWYDGPDSLMADCGDLLSVSKQHQAAVFYGVLPRRERGKGKAEDTLRGSVVWIDLDFRSFGGGEKEARERLFTYTDPPSIVVRSGHGLHGYWLLEKPAEPADLSNASRGLAYMIGGDHAFDAARLLRLPGTTNWKDPDNPVPVDIELLNTERVYDFDQLRLMLPSFADTPDDETQDEAQPDDGGFQPFGPLLWPIQAVLDKHARLRALFEGRGKTELGDNGRPLDQSSSGYDFSVVLALIKKGITDPDLLANALCNRPDESAKSKGEQYIRRTVTKAQKRADHLGAELEDLEVSFKVDHVRIFDSTPAIYEFRIEGKLLRVSSAQLRSPRSFAVRFMDVLQRIPRLPNKPDEWAEIVNRWLQGAETVKQPQEASEEFALRDAVVRAIDDLPLGEKPEDLDYGNAVLVEEGKRAFKTDTLRKALADDWPKLTRHDLCRVLRDLGYDSGSHRHEGKVFRAWSL